LFLSLEKPLPLCTCPTLVSVFLQLYHGHNFEVATMCFERAGDIYWQKRSQASGLRANADRMCGSNPEKANVILREAAEIFEAIGKADSAANCFYDLGEYERAGMHWIL
jgi:hypothetical protein